MGGSSSLVVILSINSSATTSHSLNQVYILDGQKVLVISFCWLKYSPVIQAVTFLIPSSRSQTTFQGVISQSHHPKKGHESESLGCLFYQSFAIYSNWFVGSASKPSSPSRVFRSFLVICLGRHGVPKTLGIRPPWRFFPHDCQVVEMVICSTFLLMYSEGHPSRKKRQT